MISKAKLAEMARAAAEARTLDLIASKNAEMAAIEQAKIRKRLESHAELYRAAKEIISNFKLRWVCLYLYAMILCACRCVRLMSSVLTAYSSLSLPYQNRCWGGSEATIPRSGSSRGKSAGCGRSGGSG